ncbi:hypothetical protein [Halomonas sp.]|uniref:hypothetical protein n=1 Tax=Halomonas sp. TaxID=1486246 RepID=UPI0035646841
MSDVDPGEVIRPTPDQRRDVPGDMAGTPLQMVDNYAVYTELPSDRTVPRWLTIEEHPDNPEVYSRKWVFQGVDGIMVLYEYIRHRYGEGKEPPQVDSQRKPCCLKIMQDNGLSTRHCPDEVRDLVARVTDAPVASLNEFDHGPTATE